MTDTIATTQQAVFGEMKKNWGWMLTGGIVMLILGTIGLGMTFTLTIVSVLYIGVLMLFGSGVQIVDAFRCKGWKSVLWHVLIALIYLAVGIMIIRDPVMASAALTLFIGGALGAIGLMRIIVAIQMRGVSGWIWTLIAGLAAIALAVMIFAKWPVSGMWVIGMFVAIELMFNGWSYIAIALAAKQAGKDEAHPGGTAAAVS